MVRASFGTSTWPESTRVMRLPSITTVALSTGLPPFPSMSRPPRTTIGAFLAAMIIFPPLLLTIHFSRIETIDKTALIQFSNEAHICEVFGLGIPCPRILLRKAIQDRLDAIQGRILLAREHIVGHGKIINLHICEVFGLGIPCPRILLRKAIQDRLDAIQGRILLAREHIVGHGKIISL